MGWLVFHHRVGGERFLRPWIWFTLAFFLFLLGVSINVVAYFASKESTTSDQNTMESSEHEAKQAGKQLKPLEKQLSILEYYAAGARVLTVKYVPFAIPEWLPFLHGFLLILCVRKFVIGRLAYGPGAVEVLDFVDASGGEKVSVKGVTSIFRDKLANSLIPTPTPIPGSSVPTKLVQVVQEKQLEKGIIPALLSLAIDIWPKISYQITGTLVYRKDAPNYGVSVRIFGYGSRLGATIVKWNTSWEAATEEAAHGTISKILPHTKLGTKQPWSSWQGKDLSERLFGLYERAKELATQFRYDESLDTYYQALRDDPRNTSLRLGVASVQEKLGLFLDVLDTYLNIISIGPFGHSNSESEQHSTLAKYFKKAFFFSREIRLWRQLCFHDAWTPQYRYLITLGFSEKLANQWHLDSFGPKRNLDRKRLRDRIRPVLLERYLMGFCTHFGVEPDLGRKSLDQVSEGGEFGAHERSMRKMHLELLFLHASYIESVKLLSDLTWYRRRLSKTILTKSSLNLIRVWLDIKRHNLIRRYGSLVNHMPIRMNASFTNKPLQTAAQVREEIESSIRRPFRKHGHKWFDNYNAACICATAITPSGKRYAGRHINMVASVPEDHAEQEQFVGFAVEYLRKAFLQSDHDLLARHRDWVLSDDPDLNNLRPHRLFTQFESRFFPSQFPAYPRPEFIHSIEASRYISEVLSSASRVMEQRWHLRRKALKEEIDIHSQLAWWREESMILSSVLDFSLNPRHWQSRIRLLYSINEAEEACGIFLKVRFRRLHGYFPHIELTEDTVKRETARMSRLDQSLEQLAASLATTDIPNLSQKCLPKSLVRGRVTEMARKWLDYLTDIDLGVKKQSQDFLRSCGQVAEERAAIWQGMCEWFSSPGANKSYSYLATARRLSSPPRAQEPISLSP